MSNLSAQLPVMTQPVADNSGNLTAPWYRLLLSLYSRTGQASGVTVKNYQIVAPQAGSVALSSGVSTVLVQGSGSVTLQAPPNPIDGQETTIAGPVGMTFLATWVHGAITNPLRIQYFGGLKQWWAT